MLDLLDLNKKELRDLVGSLGEPEFRTAQIERWLYHDLVTDFDAMKNLPREFRAQLSRVARIGAPQEIARSRSRDGMTRKTLLDLGDRNTVESVLMLYDDTPSEEKPRLARRTVCISTQVGCPVGCPFCATGQAGYVRNLTSGEIIVQVLHFARELRPKLVTNVVIMGMGEPFMKFDVTWQAIEAFTDSERFGLGARHITVSTSGQVPGIERMTNEKLQVNLAVSLHAPDDKLRDVLVPLNRKYPLRELLRAIRGYIAKTRRRVTFEYALMDHVNDSPEQARALAQLIGDMLCHVNLIPLNPTATEKFSRTPYGRVKQFEKILRDAGIPTTLRVEKGIEIAAGCGQLRQTNSGLIPAHA